MIDRYVRDFSRWIAGSPARRVALGRELQAHLAEAQKAGLLEETLERLGSPREAARAFSEGHPMRPAPLRLRLPAAVVDLMPLGVLLFAAYWHPDWPGPYLYDVTRLVLIGLAILWWSLVLPLAEWRAGRTPGKRMFGLRVVCEDGTAVSRGQALIRRVPTFFAFPMLVVDLPVALYDEGHRRAFDRVAGTVVVTDPEDEQRAPPDNRTRALKAHLVTYLFGNLLLMEMWAVGTLVVGVRFFWPIFPMLAWSLGLAAHAWGTLEELKRRTPPA